MVGSGSATLPAVNVKEQLSQDYYCFFKSSLGCLCIVCIVCIGRGRELLELC